MDIIMTNRERENKTLSFQKVNSRGSVEETFYPWNLTISRFIDDGLPTKFAFNKQIPTSEKRQYRYHYTQMANSTHNEYEKFLGFDSIKRLAFFAPFRCFEKKILEETNTYRLKQDEDGWTRKYYHNNLVHDVRPVITSQNDWDLLKKKMLFELDEYFTDNTISELYTPFKVDHQNGIYSIRFRILGFFWVPRELFGIEKHFLAFHDYPVLIHEINNFLLNIYLKYLDKIFNIISPDVILISEDLSGNNGPMLSPTNFDEFVGSYYKRLIPFLKKKGVKSIFVDTDGDFTILIPNFIKVGVDGFLPMDVNAGIDIIKVRENYPQLQFIGGFNKLAIAEGKDAINREFERLIPIIRQGGYIPGADHQVAPSTSLENYKYYIRKLKEAMMQSGSAL